MAVPTDNNISVKNIISKYKYEEIENLKKYMAS